MREKLQQEQTKSAFNEALDQRMQHQMLQEGIEIDQTEFPVHVSDNETAFALRELDSSILGFK